MPIKSRTCLTVACDVCDLPLQDDDDATLHLPDVEEARSLARVLQWSVLSGDEFVCTVGDDAHQAFLDRLMPPEPTMPVTGQLGFDDAVQP